MKTHLILVLLFATTICSCETKTQPKTEGQKIHSKEFDWTVTIPEGFETVTPEDWAKMQNRGNEAIEKTYGEKIENNSKTIFVFKSDKLNYFESNYQPFDSSAFTSYLESFRTVNNLLYGTFEAQMPDAKLDSTSSSEVIDGLTFQTFRVNITMPDNKMVMEFLMYCRLFGTKEFTVNIMTVDKEKQKILLEAWKNSKFGNK